MPKGRADGKPVGAGRAARGLRRKCGVKAKPMAPVWNESEAVEDGSPPLWRSGIAEAGLEDPRSPRAVRPLIFAAPIGGRQIGLRTSRLLTGIQ